jgi:DNA-binding GntR family transcriptional regulator
MSERERDPPQSILPMMQVRTKTQAVYQELSAHILAGRMEPGSTVNQEGLAASLGVSITPLREALRRLESDGLVILEAHRTLTVAPLSLSEVRELYAVRLQLDPFAAGLAAKLASPEAVERIKALAARKLEATARGRLKANREFHQAIYRSPGNATLAEILDRLWDRTDRYRLIVVQVESEGRKVEREHRKIAAAIRARDAKLATELMRSHVETTLTLVEEHAVLG